ncbi:MAG: cyclic nucleotide-binding domain-containing protein [Planctomycetota bacterium]|jgi:CRP-like cAMP-binding protein
MKSGALGKVYHDGEVILRQGDVGDCMYVIQEGQVQILVEQGGQERLVRVARTGELIGEMAIFEKQARSATVRAEGDVRLLTIDKKNFLRRISEDPSIALRIVQTMSQRIRELSQEVARLKRQELTRPSDE